MDPLSITLGVISVATAVKDMVELAQKIHRSFAKVPNNLRNAQRVAENITDMVEEINVFCKDHEDMLVNMKSFHEALQGLLSEFRSFETLILPLLPTTGQRKFGVFFRGWLNNDKIRESISDLESNIVKVIRKYMMKSTMRAEIELQTIHEETTRGLHILEVIQRDMSTIRTTAAAAMPVTPYYSYGSSELASNKSNYNVIMFAQSSPSASAPILHVPDGFTEELTTTAYIRLQLNSIAKTVQKISIIPAPAPSSIRIFAWAPILKEASMSIMRLRHHIVREVTHIRDLVEIERLQNVSIYDGVHALNDLSVALNILDMRHESMLVGNWTVTIARKLVLVDNENPDLSAWLAFYLFNQSIRYNNTDDKSRSVQAIDEAYAIIQNLLNQYNADSRFQTLYSNVLLQYAQLVDNKRSIEMSLEAVQVLEGVLDIQALTQSISHEIVVRPKSRVLDHLLFSSSAITAIRCYALALRRLGMYLLMDDQPKVAIDLAQLAIALCRKILSIHGDEYKVDLALALSLLMRSQTASHIPGEELIYIADECVQLFRELAEKNPQLYARELVSILWEKANILERLNRDTEAIETWEDAVCLASQNVQDSELCARILGRLSAQFRCLKRHGDAVRTGTLAITTYRDQPEIQAWRYFYLSNDLRQLQRYKESAEAAQTSVTLYRHLALSHPSVTWTADLVEGLSDLAYCLAATGDYSEALVAWKESVRLIDDLLTTHIGASSYTINRCCAALSIHRKLSLILNDDEECLRVCSTAVKFLYQLSKLYPENTDMVTMSTMLWVECHYAYNMLRVGHLQDALDYIDNWLGRWGGKPDAISHPNHASAHAAIVFLKAEVLDAQGYTKQALSTISEIHDIVRPSIHTYQLSFSQMVDSMILEARNQVNLGNSRQALEVVENGLRLSRDSRLEPVVENLVSSLHAVAQTALSCQDYKRAYEAAQEGCKVSSTSEWRDIEEDHNISIRPGLLSVLSYADANLGRCSTALEFAHLAVNASLEIKDLRAKISATTAEKSYIETRGYLAEILLATGDLAQAQQICEERRAYFTQRVVNTRMGEYRELAPILRMVGILCCNKGRHEEGDAAFQELSRIMKVLENTFPSLQEQLKVRLRHQIEVPILKVLNDMCKRLDCGHHTGTLWLFKA